MSNVNVGCVVNISCLAIAALFQQKRCNDRIAVVRKLKISYSFVPYLSSAIVAEVICCVGCSGLCEWLGRLFLAEACVVGSSIVEPLNSKHWIKCSIPYQFLENFQYSKATQLISHLKKFRSKTSRNLWHTADFAFLCILHKADDQNPSPLLTFHPPSPSSSSRESVGTGGCLFEYV